MVYTISQQEESMPEKDEKVKKSKVVPAKQRWSSDVIVDMLHLYDFPYASMNPGATFRALHDSIINYGQNKPYLMHCQHEEIAVEIAHGYAKASGKPMVAMLHNLVGMLHANLAVYYAYIDRAPVFIIGATGPMDETRRRPRIDWIHSANVQGEALRPYTKWDYQPTTIDGVPESFARAYGVMMTEPQGPIYMCYDAWLQEAPLNHDVPIPPPGAVKVPTLMAADPHALSQVAQMMMKAKHPVILTEYVGRQVAGFEALVKLAETVAAPVYDVNSRLNFPGDHSLNLSMAKDVFRDADLIICLDTRDWERPTTELDRTTRTMKSLVSSDCKWIDIGFGDLELSSWAMDYQRLLHADLRIMADTTTAIPALTELCRDLLAKNASLKPVIEKRFEETRKKHEALRAKWAKEAQENWDASPLSLPRLASEVWEVIQKEDWVLTANTLEDWTLKLWNFDKPYRHAGKSMGTATQIGISIGVALAHRDKGRLVVDLQPDGDLMYDAGALWVAAKHKIPMLVVMYNNRAYCNSLDHQSRMAKLRGTPLERAHIAVDICDPDPDFAGLARAMGWHAEGPIDKGKDVKPALKRAIERVKAGQPALVDTITQRR
jgi:acetolactate synthase-1/2/3 large subunit